MKNIRNIRNVILICSLFSATLFITINWANAKIRTIIYEKEQSKEQNKHFTNNTKINNTEFNTTLSIKLINSHIQIGQKININKEDNLLLTIKTLEELSLLDIISTLELSKDKNQTLNDFIKESEEIIHKANNYISIFEQEINFIKSEITECSLQKQNSDQTYFISIKNYNKIEMDNALQESIKLSSCIAENTTKYNAQLELLNKMNYYFALLSKKQYYLENNKKTIIKHFDIIKSETIKELDLIQKTLKYWSF